MQGTGLLSQDRTYLDLSICSVTGLPWVPNEKKQIWKDGHRWVLRAQGLLVPHMYNVRFTIVEHVSGRERRDVIQVDSNLMMSRGGCHTLVSPSFVFKKSTAGQGLYLQLVLIYDLPAVGYADIKVGSTEFTVRCRQFCPNDLQTKRRSYKKNHKNSNPLAAVAEPDTSDPQITPYDIPDVGARQYVHLLRPAHFPHLP